VEGISENFESSPCPPPPWMFKGVKICTADKNIINMNGNPFVVVFCSASVRSKTRGKGFFS
jgi:hypothetical protein